MTVETSPKTKKCSKCGEDKPLSEFYTQGPDKIRPECKECARMAEWVRYHRKGGTLRPRGIGIDTFKQVQSVVRNLAELQAAVDTEIKRRDSLFSQIYADSAKVIEPWVLRQISLKFLIERYRQKHYGKAIEVFTRRCVFGVVYFSKDGTEIKLDADKARERLGKP